MSTLSTGLRGGCLHTDVCSVDEAEEIQQGYGRHDAPVNLAAEFGFGFRVEGHEGVAISAVVSPSCSALMFWDGWLTDPSPTLPSLQFHAHPHRGARPHPSSQWQSSRPPSPGPRLVKSGVSQNPGNVEQTKEESENLGRDVERYILPSSRLLYFLASWLRSTKTRVAVPGRKWMRWKRGTPWLGCLAQRMGASPRAAIVGQQCV